MSTEAHDAVIDREMCSILADLGSAGLGWTSTAEQEGAKDILREALRNTYEAGVGFGRYEDVDSDYYAVIWNRS